jgi:hypothetical protein
VRYDVFNNLFMVDGHQFNPRESQNYVLRPAGLNRHGAFSRHGEAVPTAQEAGRPRVAAASFPSARDRLFLGGLLASRARLSFTGSPPF